MVTSESDADNPESQDESRLFELFNQLSQSSDPAIRRSLHAVIFSQTTMKAKLLEARNRVLGNWNSSQDFHSELEQETRYRLLREFINVSKIMERTTSDHFSGYLFAIILCNTRRAWSKCQPIWMKRRVRPRKPSRRPVVHFTVDFDDWLDLQAAISQISDLLQRQIVEEWLAGFSVVQSARCHNLSYSAVRKHRQKLLAYLRIRLRIR